MSTRHVGRASLNAMVLPVAVVIPTHNRADRLARIVRALEAQEVRPSEVIFVDDASADETPATLAELARTTTLSLRIIRLTTPAGPHGARKPGGAGDPAAVRASNHR